LDSWLVNTAASPAGAPSERDAVSRWKKTKMYMIAQIPSETGGKVWSAWTEFINKENILKNIFLMY
jgi:hypothetical protein